MRGKGVEFSCKLRERDGHEKVVMERGREKVRVVEERECRAEQFSGSAVRARWREMYCC